MELKIKKNEVDNYLKRLYDVSHLALKIDPQSSYGWAVKRNMDKFVSEQNHIAKKKAEIFTVNKKVKEHKDYVEAQQNAQKDHVKIHGLDREGRIVNEKGLQDMYDKLSKEYPKGREIEQEQQKKLTEYLEKEVEIEIKTVPPNRQPIMNAYQINCCEFMLEKESGLKIV